MTGDKRSALAFCASVACIELGVLFVIAQQVRAVFA